MLKYFLQYEFIFLFRIPKMLKTEQRVCLVLPGYWIHEKAEKADGSVYEEIFCKVFYANPKALLRLLKTSIFVSFGKRVQL